MTQAPSMEHSYILRGIDPQLWRAVKRKAQDEGRDIKTILLRLLPLYTRFGLETLERRVTRKG